MGHGPHCTRLPDYVELGLKLPTQSDRRLYRFLAEADPWLANVCTLNKLGHRRVFGCPPNALTFLRKLSAR